VITVEMLRRHLEHRGLDLLGVSQHHADPEVLVVYLNGMSGQDHDGAARLVIASVPGVLAVADSVPTPKIILVRVGRQATR
jgi:hypothetical protein